jgi:hypothetical protein
LHALFQSGRILCQAPGVLGQLVLHARQGFAQVALSYGVQLVGNGILSARELRRFLGLAALLRRLTGRRLA